MKDRLGSTVPLSPTSRSVIQRQIPVGTHVEVADPGGNWFGQIAATQPGQRYVVRVGGTDRTVSVGERQIKLHPMTRAAIESAAKREQPLTSRAWNIVRGSAEVERSAESIKIKRQGLKKVIGQAAYMTGDMIGILSAMALDPDLCVDILVDQSYYVKAYKKDADALKLPLADFYVLKHPRDRATLTDVLDKTTWIEKKLSLRMQEQADMMVRTYRAAGITVDRITIKPVEDAQKAYKLYELAFVKAPKGESRPAYYATSQVAEAFRKDAKAARAHLAGVMFFNVDPTAAAKIEEFCALRFQQGEKLLLLWGRRSGQNPGGAHPELDTNKYAMLQILRMLRQRDPLRKVAVIGDPIFKRLGDSKKQANRDYIDLVEFWDHVWPGHRLDRLAQLYFLHCLNTRCDVIAVGMRSGVLEGPALLGMRTLFLEDLVCHPEFEGNVGDRMEMWSGGIGGTAAVRNYRRVQTVAKLGVITEMHSNLQLIRAFWTSHPPAFSGKLVPPDHAIKETMKTLTQFASQSTLILDPARKRVRFIDPVTLTTMGNRAMAEEVGKAKKEPTEETPVPLPALNDCINTCARTLRTIVQNYHKAGVSNLPQPDRDVAYYVLKDALKILVRLSAQDLRLVVMNFARLERMR